MTFKERHCHSTHAAGEYKRQTKSTARTAHNLRRVVEFIENNPGATQSDVACMLCYSISGTRKYLYTLEKAGVVDVRPVIAAVSRNAIPSYSLIQDKERIALYLKSVGKLSRDSEMLQAAARRKRVAEGLMPGTHIHTSQDDDEMYSRKPIQNQKVAVRRDPMDVAFFGDGPAPSLALEMEAA